MNDPSQGLSAQIRLTVGTLDVDVELDVAPGELLAILGPNGAGKTTVLRAIAGLAPIDHGQIRIDTTIVDDPQSGRFVAPDKRRVGVVFQDYLLFPSMSVLDNVAFGLRATGISKADANRRAAATLDDVGLADYAQQRPRVLSGGQAQRAALARTLATQPRVLLLDEPLAALDVGTRAEMRRELRRHLDAFDGMRVLVTHDPIDAFALADRVAIIESGHVVQSGTLAEVTSHPRSRYVAELVGVNLVAGRVDGDRLVTANGAVVVVADASDGASYAVIRPHSIALTTQAPVDSSPRNVWPGTVTDVDRLGGRARVRVDGPLPLTAEVTIQALDDLSLQPGNDVYAAVKATDIDVFPA